MRETIRQIIETYAEGGTIAAAIDARILKRGDYYRALREHPDLKQLYLEVQTARADMMVDEAYELAADNTKNPQLARVQAEIRLKIAAFFDRPRFGDKIDMTVDQTVSVSGALEAAKQRALQPRRNLADVQDGEVTEIAQLNAPCATDTKSERPAIVPDPSIDPFGE
jgi:hypothetical protein